MKHKIIHISIDDVKYKTHGDKSILIKTSGIILNYYWFEEKVELVKLI